VQTHLFVMMVPAIGAACAPARAFLFIDAEAGP
jgi:hypothetical protein